MRGAARVKDLHLCPLTAPAVHIGGPILPMGAPNTKINGRHAARVNDNLFCNAPAPDTIRGGLLTVFIDGSPASRILDKSDAGIIITASTNVFLGENAAGPLSPFQAQWLYDYLAKQGNIPFEYAADGCFARADRMSEIINSLGIPVEKKWIWDRTGDNGLHVPIVGYPGGGVDWRYHVAPVIPVQGTSGMIMDPSLNPGGPISVADWAALMTPGGVSTVMTTTDADVYYQPWDPATKTWRTPQNRDSATTAQDLNLYREERENLPPSSGRGIPNNPVHY